MTRAALIAACVAGPAGAERLLCLGTSTGFMLDAAGSEVRFDYLGDGTFRLEPPLTQAGSLASRHELVAAAARMPMFLSRTPCQIAGVTLPETVEVVVRSASGPRTMSGCCLRRPVP